MEQGPGSQGPPPATGGGATITPLDIQQKEFRVSRFGGYRMRDVDEFLDKLTEVVSGLTEENARLRRQAGAEPVVGSPDLDDVARQADEIIQRARDEAARIDTEARARASLAPAPAFASEGTGRPSRRSWRRNERSSRASPGSSKVMPRRSKAWRGARGVPTSHRRHPPKVQTRRRLRRSRWRTNRRRHGPPSRRAIPTRVRSWRSGTPRRRRAFPRLRSRASWRRPVRPRPDEPRIAATGAILPCGSSSGARKSERQGRAQRHARFRLTVAVSSSISMTSRMIASGIAPRTSSTARVSAAISSR